MWNRSPGERRPIWDTAIRGAQVSAPMAGKRSRAMLVRQRTTDHTRTALAGLTGAAAVAATVAVAACGSTQAPAAGGSPSSQPASPSSGATLQASSGVCSAVPKLTALTVHRVNDLPQNHLKFVFPATEVVTSATQVQTVARN